VWTKWPHFRSLPRAERTDSAVLLEDDVVELDAPRGRGPAEVVEADAQHDVGAELERVLLSHEMDRTRGDLRAVDGTMGLFLRDSGRRILTFTPGDRQVWALAFDPHGRTIAVGGTSGPIYLVSASSVALRQTLSGHSKGTISLAFSHDGKSLLSGGGDQHVRVWRGF